MTDVDIRNLVNLDRYPIQDERCAAAPGSEWTEAYQRTGICELPGFVTPSAVEAMAAEANKLIPQAFFSDTTHTVYLNDPGLEDRHQTTRVGSVANDCLPAASLLRALYEWDALTRFVCQVLGKASLHRLADPLGACSINVFRENDEHGWHYDESEFSVTLMLQAPVDGGAFEVLPHLRQATDEKTRIDRLLHGDVTGVIRIPFTPGTLLVFAGRNSLHRVTRIAGATARLVPVLCYSDMPGVTNSASVQKRFWGRQADHASNGA